MYEYTSAEHQGRCPYCGRSSTLMTERGPRGVSSWSDPCHPCVIRSSLRRARAGAVLAIIEPQISVALANVLKRSADDPLRGVDDLATATDAELLAMRGFGKTYLAAFRKAWPAPARIEDPWRAHAEMVAGRA